MPVHSKGKKQIFVPYNAKIADITHADTNKHMLDLEIALTEARKIIAILPKAARTSGSGGLVVYPNEGTTHTGDINLYCRGWIVIADGTQRLQYSLLVANDGFDLYCYGYVVET